MELQIKKLISDEKFIDLAKYIMCENHIKANNNNYRIVEMELYICNDKHKDIFTHCHSRQKTMLNWYFHQMSEKENSYKGGTFKGLDISCGFDSGYGGILIRSILNEATNQVIEGPCNVVNELLKVTKFDTIISLVTSLNGDLSCIKHDILKLEGKHFDSEDIYVAPRIGLSLKGSNVEEKKKYLDRKYRYIIQKDKVKKEKKKMEIYESQ